MPRNNLSKHQLESGRFYSYHPESTANFLYFKPQGHHLLYCLTCDTAMPFDELADDGWFVVQLGVSQIVMADRAQMLFNHWYIRNYVSKKDSEGHHGQVRDDN